MEENTLACKNLIPKKYGDTVTSTLYLKLADPTQEQEFSERHYGKNRQMGNSHI